ncbi:MAG: LegC family aminotransferase [Planctomycetes bacterium]|nr:LegC family aminotransferase [Planctomycetota bacterium]
MTTTSEPSSAVERRPIPLSVPCLDGREMEYVRECLETNWISSAGPFVTKFEAELAARIGVPHAVATSSGTAALHLALLAADVQRNDEVIVPTLTFIATANAVRYVGAWPVFVDAESKHWQIDVELVRRFLEEHCEMRDGRLVNCRTWRRVRAILPVHLLGHPADLEPLLELARRFSLTVIEDCAESLGAEYHSRPTGSWGIAGCFSFNGNKTFSTGGGGMLVTRDESLALRARHLSTQAKSGTDEYIHDDVGFNYRMPNILAAIGCAQLERFEILLDSKRQIAAHYRRALAGVPGLTFPIEALDVRSSNWLSTVRIDAAAFGSSSRQLREILRQASVESRPLWQPMHLSPAHRGAPHLLSGVAEQLYEDCLSLPSSADLADSSLRYVVDTIRGAAREDSRDGRSPPAQLRGAA